MTGARDRSAPSQRMFKGLVSVQPPVHILIACMPKAGSSFLSNVIAQLPGFRRAPLVPAYDRREHELDVAAARAMDRYDYVAQHHVRYSRWTADVCRDYAIAPVVLIRSLFDLTVSLRDALRTDGPVWPFFFAEPAHAAMDDAQLDEMIVRLALPWYVNFYMSWRAAPDALLVEYERLVLDPAATVLDVLAFTGARASKAEVQSAIKAVTGTAQSRLNVGLIGRGASLSPELVREILRMLDFYPAAAADPWVLTMKAEGEAILARQPRWVAAGPRRAPVRRAPQLRRWWRRMAPRVVVRGLVPIALIACGYVYWTMPQHLQPFPHTRLDDWTVLIAACALAGRLTTFKPRALRWVSRTGAVAGRR